MTLLSSCPEPKGEVRLGNLSLWSSSWWAAPVLILHFGMNSYSNVRLQMLSHFITENYWSMRDMSLKKPHMQTTNTKHIHQTIQSEKEFKIYVHVISNKEGRKAEYHCLFLSILLWFFFSSHTILFFFVYLRHQLLTSCCCPDVLGLQKFWRMQFAIRHTGLKL